MLPRILLLRPDSQTLKTAGASPQGVRRKKFERGTDEINRLTAKSAAITMPASFRKRSHANRPPTLLISEDRLGMGANGVDRIGANDKPQRRIRMLYRFEGKSGSLFGITPLLVVNITEKPASGPDCGIIDVGRWH